MRLHIIVSIIALSATLIGCGSPRRVSSDPLSQEEIERFAHDYIFMEGVRVNNLDKHDASMDLILHGIEIDTTSASTAYMLAQHYMSLNDRTVQDRYKQTCEMLLLRAVRLEPDNYWYRRLLAVFYLWNNRVIDGIREYEDMAICFPKRTDILLTLAELYDGVGDYDKELRVLNRYGKIEDVEEQLKFQRFACYLRMNEWDSAYYETDTPVQVIEGLMESVSDMLSSAQTQLDRMKCRSDIEVVMNFCDVVSKHEPELIEPYTQKSIAYFWLGENDKAFKTLSYGLEQVKSDTHKAMLYNLRGDMYHSIGENKLMYADYDSTLIYDPDNIGVLNNYAYFMAVEDRELDRALRMSAKTIKYEPSNPTFLDTYAWILFRMKRYTDALHYIEEAIQYSNDNPELFEHYGDILFMCGNQEKAIENWHRAMQLNSQSSTLDRKIKEGKYVE